MPDTATMADVVTLTIRAALAPVQAQQAVLAEKCTRLEAEVATLNALRERMAVVETRPGLPGLPGKDGADGIGLDQLVAVQDPADCRVVSLQVQHGDSVKTISTLRFAVPHFCGDYKADRSYAPGDEVRQNGLWLCETANPGRPGTPESGWKLLVKGSV